MEFFEAISRRRSVRVYSTKSVPPDVINKAIDAALIAPNSSNMQTWRIYWVKDQKKKQALITACLNQSAARTAQELVVFTCNPKHWKTSQRYLLEEAQSSPRTDLKDYYGKLMPLIYSYLWLAPIKWISFNLIGLFKPMVREVASRRDIQEVCVKSTALACENFMLAIAAQGFDTCPMEGFDAPRVRKILGVSCSESVVMVVSVGERSENGIWGRQYRIPREIVVKTI